MSLKIVLLSDSPFLPTGYRNQAIQLVRYLVKQGHQVWWLGNAYNGSIIKKITFEDNSTLEIEGLIGEMKHTYFSSSIEYWLKKIKPDRMICLLDTFMLMQSGYMNKDLSPAKTFFWFPSDGGGGMPRGCENILRKFDVPVAMAQFGQKQVKDYYNIDTKYIPHGCDPKRFYRFPNNQRDELRAKMGLSGKFVIGVVARNQPRKNLDRTIKAMRLIADKIPNAMLYLHIDPSDPAQPNPINEIIKHYNLENRVVYSGMTCHNGFPDSRMNEVYNMMDCFLLTTSGEGFGIPIIEAMSCEIPIIATDYTTTPELVLNNNAGLGIQLSGVNPVEMYGMDMKNYDVGCFDGTMTGSWMVERGMCSIKDCATKVKFIYDNPTIAQQMGINGRKAVREKYDIRKVCKAWGKLLNE